MSWNAGPEGEFFLGLAYGPCIPHVHPRLNDLAWPHVRGWVTEPLGDTRFLHTDIV